MATYSRKTSIRTIAIETSGRQGSVALAEEGTVLEEAQFPHGLQHAAEIIPIIDRLCSARSWRPADVNHLYLSIGPGSFTGLRIAVTLAKTMALATGVRIVAVPTVRVLAENAPADARHLAIVLDAKRGQIYTARFDRGPGGEWIERQPAHLSTLTTVLADAPRPLHLLGEGIDYHRQFIPAGDAQIVVTPREGWRGRAAAVAGLGYTLAVAGQFSDPERLVPLYIRPPEAEERLAR